MAPFSISLRPKRSRSARPRTPSSPASFASPRSPTWFVTPSWPPEQLLPDIKTAQGAKTPVLAQKSDSGAADGSTQHAEQEKIQAIAVPRPSTTTGVRRPSPTSVASSSLTHRRAESQGLSSNVHASARRGPPPPIQIRSMRDMSTSPNRKATRTKGEPGRFGSKDLPPVPDREEKANAIKGTSVPEARDASRQDKLVVPDQSDSTATRLPSGGRPKKSSKELLRDDSKEALPNRPQGNVRRERSATEATIIPSAPPLNASEIVNTLNLSLGPTVRSESLPAIKSTAMQGALMTPVVSQPQTVSASPTAPLLVEHAHRSGAAASSRPKLITIIASPFAEAVTGASPLSPVPSTNESAFYQPYHPQAGDLLFSPNFILASSESGHTPGLFPENYSMRMSSQFVSGLSQEDAEFLSTAHGVLDLRPPLMMAETMARQDSATLPIEGDGLNSRWDFPYPAIFGDGTGDDHHEDVLQHPHEVQLQTKSPGASDEQSPALSTASANRDSHNFSAEVSRWRSHTLDSTSSGAQLPSRHLPRQQSLRQQRSLQSTAEHAASRARSATLNSVDRLRRSVSAAIITASVSRSTSRSSETGVGDGIAAGGSTSPGGSVKGHDRLFDSAKRFLSGSGSSKPHAVHHQPGGALGPRSDGALGDLKGKGKSNPAVSISDVVTTINSLGPDRQGYVNVSNNSSPNAASRPYIPITSDFLSSSQPHAQRPSRQQPQQRSHGPASTSSSATTPSSYSPLTPFSRPTPQSHHSNTSPSSDDTSPIRFAGESKAPPTSFHLRYSRSNHPGPRVRSASESSTIIGPGSASGTRPPSPLFLHTTQYHHHPRHPSHDEMGPSRPSTESPRSHVRALTSVSLSDLNSRYNSAENGASSVTISLGTPFPSKLRRKRSHRTAPRLASSEGPLTSSSKSDAMTLQPQTQMASTTVAVPSSPPRPRESPGAIYPHKPRESSASIASVSDSTIANSNGTLQPATSTSHPHRKPALPIGPRSRPVPISRAGSHDGIRRPTMIGSSKQKATSQNSVPTITQISAASASAPPPPRLSHMTHVAPQDQERPSSSLSEANKTPSSPIFDSVPIQWKGLTMEQAKWTFTKPELQSLVARAIHQSAEATSIRLLSQRVLDVEFPEEIERLETRRDEIKTKYQHQVRLRKLLTRSLDLYIDGSDTEAAFRLLADLTEASVSCEMFSADLFIVMDQLAQISRLRDTHMSSALTMALHKLNAAFLRTSAETEDLREKISFLEAERDEGWAKALELEYELDAVRGQLAEATTDKSATTLPRGTRVSAARKSSSRASKASLRSSRRSARSSSHSLKIASLVFPHPPSSFHHDFIDAPLPIPTPGAHTAPAAINRLRPESVTSRMTSTGVSTPSSTTRAMVNAQNEVLEMLGLSLVDLDKNPGLANFRRPRSHSHSAHNSNTIVTAPDSPGPSRPASLHIPYSPYSLHNLSPYTRHRSISVPDRSSSFLLYPNVSPSDPDAIFRAMLSRATP